MNCRRATELWSDSHAGSLPAPLEHSLRAHLDSCAACREAYGSFQAVVEGLASLSVPEPPESLTERILARTGSELRARARERASSPHAPVLRVPAGSWIAVAAILAILLLWRPPELVSSWSQRASRTARQTYSYAVRSYHQSERWLDDLNVLRMTVGVAFEDCLDRLNEQLRSFSDEEEDTPETDSDQSRTMRPEPARIGSTSPSHLSLRSHA